MTRTVLDKELQDLDAQILRLGALVDDALDKALAALEVDDLAKSGMVIEADSIIDGLRMAIEEHTIRLLTLQQPLGSRDLRYLTSALSIAGDLERIGDGAAGIATIMLRMSPLRANDGNNGGGNRSGKQGSVVKASGKKSGDYEIEVTEEEILRSLLNLGREARRVLQGTMQAFAKRDVEAARYIWQEDDVVDVRYHLVRHDLMALLSGAHAIPALQNDALILQRATYLLWIAHKLERVADHCTNICERIAFIVEGENSIKPLELE
ncbi:MAG TPA: PhoU domain-containing protein [Ktedonobacteraceae bacterium]|nr:PhoU domain-containing protein [Ktedonobacteraceae bacterium]